MVVWKSILLTHKNEVEFFCTFIEICIKIWFRHSCPLRMNSNNSGDPFTFHLPLSSKFYGQIFPSASAVLWVWCWLANVSMLTCEQSNQPLLVTVNMLALSSKQRCTQVQRHRAANMAVDSLRNTSPPRGTICVSVAHPVLHWICKKRFPIMPLVDEEFWNWNFLISWSQRRPHLTATEF